MARLPFTDTHVHFHDLREPSLTYAWLRPEDPSESPADLGSFGAIKSERYHADDFIAETRFANVERVVHVQAAIGTDDPAEETRWLQAFADRTGVPHGIVAYCDLADPGAAALLERHAAYANLRGIRDLRYDGYLGDEAWLAGLALLEGRDLVWCDDPLVEQMALAAEVARRHPGVTLCVDHAGYPRQRDEATFRAWRDGMQELAAVPTTVVKISGLGMADHAWTVDSLRPWVHTCLELWGVDRAVFGTNWPVDRLFSSYGDVLDAYAELIAELPAADQAALFSGNARRVFRLDAPGGDRMERVGNVWRVRPGKAEEYQRRHATVWPEIDALLREVGVERYTIYLWGELVFSHLEVPSYDELVRRFGCDPVAQRWEEEMADLIEYPSADPDSGWPERLVEVWSL